jgi:hypothetical protein
MTETEELLFISYTSTQSLSIVCVSTIGHEAAKGVPKFDFDLKTNIRCFELPLRYFISKPQIRDGITKSFAP